MTPAEVIEQVEELTDIELAVLLSLVAQENCVIIQTAEVLRSLQEEVQCVCTLSLVRHRRAEYCRSLEMFLVFLMSS